MRMRMKNGDYVPDNLGGFQQVQGDEQILSAALFLLTARKGRFAPLPEVGSRLYLLSREKPSQWESAAAVYAQEALEPLGLTVTKAVVTPGADGLQVEIYAEYQGEELRLEATVS